MKKSKLKKTVKKLKKRNTELAAERVAACSEYESLMGAYISCRRELDKLASETCEFDVEEQDERRFAGIVGDVRIYLEDGVTASAAQVFDLAGLLSGLAASHGLRIETVSVRNEAAFDDLNLASLALAFLTPDAFTKWAVRQGLDPRAAAAALEGEAGEEAGEEYACGLTRNEVAVLTAHKDHPESTQEQLAGMLGISSSEISRTVAGLGLAWKRTSPARRPKPAAEAEKDAEEAENAEGAEETEGIEAAERSQKPSEATA